MSGLLDTSVLVRYLTGGAAQLAGQAASIIDQEDGLQVRDVVLAETAYVLTSVYEVPREVVVDHLVALLRKQNIRPFGLDKDLVCQALLLCRPTGRVSFADALVWAAVRSTDDKVVYSLDERFPADEVRVLRGRKGP